MYSCSSSLKEAFDTSTNNYVIMLASKRTANTSRTIEYGYQIRQSDIVAGSFKISSSITDGKFYSAGGCMSSECTFTLTNIDGKWNDVDLKGLQLDVFMGNYDEAVIDQDTQETVPTPMPDDMVVSNNSKFLDQYHNYYVNVDPYYPSPTPEVYKGWVYKYDPQDIDQQEFYSRILPMGVFIIDDIKNNYVYENTAKRLQSISVTAHDRMVLLDTPIDENSLNIFGQQKRNSVMFKSFEFAYIIQRLNKVLFNDTINLSKINDAPPVYGFRGNWDDCKYSCARANYYSPYHGLGNLLYYYDTTMGRNPDNDFLVYSSQENTRPFYKTNFTYRNMLQGLCELCGCNAYFNRCGFLEFDWISNSIDTSVSAREWKNRTDKVALDTKKYLNFKYLTNSQIFLYGTKNKTSDDNKDENEYKWEVGGFTDTSNGYIYDLSQNKLIGESDIQVNINSKPTTPNAPTHKNLSCLLFARNRLHNNSTKTASAFKYRPFECQYVNMPYLDITDNVSTTGNINRCDSYITDITYTTTGFMTIKSRGEEISSE